MAGIVASAAAAAAATAEALLGEGTLAGTIIGAGGTAVAGTIGAGPVGTAVAGTIGAGPVGTAVGGTALASRGLGVVGIIGITGGLAVTSTVTVTGGIGVVIAAALAGVLAGVIIRRVHRDSESGPPSPQSRTIKCKTGCAVVDCVCLTTLHLQNDIGVSIKASNALQITASLRCIHDESIIHCDVKLLQFRSSEREISYTPKTRGRHELTVKVEGEHIQGSPVAIYVEAPPTTLGKPIRTIGGVNQPTSLAIGPNSECVVVETRTNKVSIFNSKGEKLRTLSLDHQGQPFDTPSGVTLDSSSNIYVVDRRKISKFSPLGLPIKSWSWQHPASMDVLPGISSVDDQLYVYNVSKNEIIRINQDLTKVSESIKISETLEPRNVQSDESGGTVQSFVRPQGDFQMQRQEITDVQHYIAGRMFHKPGVIPCGMFVDTRANLVYVTDMNKSQVVIFRSSGEYVHSFGSRGRGPGKFMTPTGIAVDVDGFVYVCDSDNDCVQVF